MTYQTILGSWPCVLVDPSRSFAVGLGPSSHQYYRRLSERSWAATGALHHKSRYEFVHTSWEPVKGKPLNCGA